MNRVEICNVGLSRIGALTISSLTQASREARMCNVFYEPSRDATLADLDWNFARKQDLLAELTEEIDGWDFIYRYPSDCITAREIYNPSKVYDEDKVEFEVGASSSGDYRIILTDLEDAQLIYTKKVDNEVLFDPIFCDALAWKMGMELAMPLRSDDKIQAACARGYALAIGSAKNRSSKEKASTPNQSSSFARSRE
jgi:hypothetical protein